MPTLVALGLLILPASLGATTSPQTSRWAPPLGGTLYTRLGTPTASPASCASVSRTTPLSFSKTTGDLQDAMTASSTSCTNAITISTADLHDAIGVVDFGVVSNLSGPHLVALDFNVTVKVSSSLTGSSNCGANAKAIAYLLISLFVVPRSTSGTFPAVWKVVLNATVLAHAKSISKQFVRNELGSVTYNFLSNKTYDLAWVSTIGVTNLVHNSALLSCKADASVAPTKGSVIGKFLWAKVV